MRYWIGEHSGKVVRADGTGHDAKVELATVDGWKLGSTDLHHNITGENNLDWDEVTPARAHAALVAAGLEKATASMS